MLWEWALAAATQRQGSDSPERAKSVMTEKVGIPANIQTAIMANHEPNDKGVYPDWADHFVFKHREAKIVKLFERHRNAAIHWFKNGHPVKSWITNSAELLGVSEKQAEKFSKELFNIKRQERQLCGRSDKISAKGAKFQ
jgi:hypothetical protein